MKYQFSPLAGLCNRIRGLLSIWRCNEPFSVYQPKTDLFPGKLQDFLDNPLIDHTEKEGLVVTWRLLVRPEEVGLDFAKVRPIKGVPAIDFEYDRIPQNVKNIYRPLFKALAWKNEILTDIKDNFADFKDFVGIHIREGYDWVTKERKRDLDQYWKVVDKNIEDKMYFVVHNPEVLEEVVKRYGNRVITYPNKSYKNDSKEDMIGWVKDLLVLSKSKLIIGHKLSSFDDTAWWLGECKSKHYGV